MYQTFSSTLYSANSKQPNITKHKKNINSLQRNIKESIHKQTNKQTNKQTQSCSIQEEQNLKQDQNIQLQIPSQQMINHDIQLKQYISGAKVFQQKNIQIINFNTKSKQNIKDSYIKDHQSKKILKEKEQKIKKHKKQKSKSQIGSNQINKLKYKLLSNRRLTLQNNHKRLILQTQNLPYQSHEYSKYLQSKSHQFEQIKLPHFKQNLKTQISSPRIHNESFQRYDKQSSMRFEQQVQKQKKLFKNHDQNKQRLKKIQLKSLQIQLVIKKVKQKRQSSLKQIIKRFNLPKLNSNIQNSLQRIIQHNQNKRTHYVLSQHKNAKTIQLKNSNIVTTNLTASISKLQQSKIKQLRKLQKKLLTNKLKPFNVKNQSQQNTQRTRQFIKQLCHSQKFKSLYR